VTTGRSATGLGGFVSVGNGTAPSPTARTREATAPAFTVVVVGAHPDDIELGAAALVTRLADDPRVELWLLILTDDDDRDVRRSEAQLSAALLGVDQARVLFAGFPDGDLECRRETVSAVRRLLADHDVEPDVAVTHTGWDSHNDHRRAAEIVQSAMRNTVLLHFAVPGSLEESRFRPTVFIDAAGARDIRAKALDAHASQAGRIARNDPMALLTEFGDRIGADLAEGYEVTVQSGARGASEFIDLIDDRPFRRLWHGITNGTPIRLVYGIPSLERDAHSPFDLDHEQRAVHRIATRFRRETSDAVGLEELSCLDEAATEALHSGSVILVGGPASNRLVRDRYRGIPGVTLCLEHDMPGYTRRRVVDRGGRSRPAVLANDQLAVDVGVVSVIPNPYCPGSAIVAAMGAYGPATAHAVDRLTEPDEVFAAQVQQSLADAKPFETAFRLPLGTPPPHLAPSARGPHRRG
jgi:LmbE family N-acetylglucosaminyl deacetylase